MLLVLTTLPSAADHETFAAAIVEKKLAACVQILPEMTSVYVWKGKVEKDDERLLLIKTLPERLDELERFIVENHPYEVPEIIAIAADKVSAAYAEWLNAAVNTQL